MRARRRRVRREGLSAASRRQAARARPQYSGRDCRRADRARGRRPRAVVAQRLSLARATQDCAVAAPDDLPRLPPIWPRAAAATTRWWPRGSSSMPPGSASIMSRCAIPRRSTPLVGPGEAGARARRRLSRQDAADRQRPGAAAPLPIDKPKLAQIFAHGARHLVRRLGEALGVWRRVGCIEIAPALEGAPRMRPRRHQLGVEHDAATGGAVILEVRPADRARAAAPARSP